MLDLEPIKARLAAATPGPWHIWTGSVAVLIQNRADPSLPDNLAKVFRNDPTGNAPMPWQANAELIAHAPADIALLIAEVERLRTALRTYGGHARTCDHEQDSSQPCSCGCS